MDTAIPNQVHRVDERSCHVVSHIMAPSRCASSVSRRTLVESATELGGSPALLATVIEAELWEWVESHTHVKDENNHRRVVRSR